MTRQPWPDSTAPARVSAWYRRWLPVVLLSLLGLGLRLHGLDRHPIWYDEAQLLGQAQLRTRTWVSRLWEPAAADRVLRIAKAPLAVILLRAWLPLGGRSEAGLRLPFVLIGLAGLVPVYLLGRRLLGHEPALIAVLLLIVHPTHIYYSQQISEYGIILLFATLSMLLFFRVQRGERGPWPLVLMASNLAALAAHPSALAILGVQILLAPFGSPGWRRRPEVWLSLGILVGVVCLFLTRSTGRVPDLLYAWIRPLTPALLGQTLRVLAHGVMSHGDLALPASERIAWLAQGALLLLIPILAMLGMQAMPRGLGRRVLVAWLLLPPLALALLSLVLRPLWVSRYLLILLPPLAFAISVGLRRLGPRRQGLALLVICGLQLPGLHRQSLVPPASLRELARDLKVGLRDDDRLLISPGTAVLPLCFYLGDGVLPPWDRTHERSYIRLDPDLFWQGTHFYHPERRMELEPEFDRWITHRRRLWVAAVKGWDGDYHTERILQYLSKRFTLVSTRSYPFDNAVLLVYELPRP